MLFKLSKKSKNWEKTKKNLLTCSQNSACEKQQANKTCLLPNIACKKPMAMLIDRVRSYADSFSLELCLYDCWGLNFFIKYIVSIHIATVMHCKPLNRFTPMPIRRCSLESWYLGNTNSYACVLVNCQYQILHYWEISIVVLP